jgi:hypothetical protein
MTVRVIDIEHGAASIQAAVEARLPQTVVQVEKSSVGWDVNAISDNDRGYNDVRFVAPRRRGAPFEFVQINSADNKDGRRFAYVALQTVLDAAIDTGVSGIHLSAGAVGSYLWPRIGFDLDRPPCGKDAAEHFLASTDVLERIHRAWPILRWSERRLLHNIVGGGGPALGARLASVDHEVTPYDARLIAGEVPFECYVERHLERAVPLTLGKVLLISTRALYVLPNTRFLLLQRYIDHRRRLLGPGEAA